MPNYVFKFQYFLITLFKYLFQFSFVRIPISSELNQPLAVHRVSSSFGIPERRLRRQSRLRTFEINDQVLVYVPVPKDSRKHIQIRKLQKFWRGPFSIERRINDVTYVVRLSPTKVQPFHISRLKPYYTRAEYQYQPFWIAKLSGFLISYLFTFIFPEILLSDSRFG